MGIVYRKTNGPLLQGTIVRQISMIEFALAKSFNHVKFNAALASICGVASMYAPYWVSGFMTGAFAALAGFHFVMWYALRKIHKTNQPK